MIEKTFNIMEKISQHPAIQAILNLDLKVLEQKLQDKEEGPGWDSVQCNRASEKYKKFLILVLKYPNKSIVPDKEIDAVWHAHILDTKKYHTDCTLTFGHYLHHYPYVGLEGDADKAEWERSFNETKTLWVKEFNESMDGNSTRQNCQATCAGRCYGK